ncbi:MAG: integrase [Muricauda sp.]|nr:integrase [Allomuricauda sp.]MBC32164.1 integrase [Allomuricauda sp.]|tara:strand:- start:5657 stop:6901 length:1245 start_codon:yes stop_codon:yes gene_type:complete
MFNPQKIISKMASIKLTLKKKALTDGSFPIFLRITKDRKHKHYKTLYNASIEEWDDKLGQFKNNTKFIQENRFLQQLKAKAFTVCSQLEIEKENYTLYDFDKAFTTKSQKKNTSKNFFYFWDEIIEELTKSGRTGDTTIHDESFKALKKFHGSTQLEFQQINFTFLSKYEVHLRSRGGTNGGISIRMRSIRIIFNIAIDRGITTADYYPFKKYKISKLKSDPNKIALDYFDVMKIIQWDSSEYPHLVDSHNYFVFSFYTRGMNFTDQMLLEWTQIGRNKIFYTRSKSKGNFSITILPPVQKILDYYKENALDTRYVFPILLRDGMTPIQIENRKKKTRKKYNKDLKEIAFHCEIDAKVTSYVARHSFANSLKQMGVATDVISEALGHRDIKVTQGYLNSLENSELDKASASLLL